MITSNLFGGPFLLVTGNLRARNLLAGDGEIRVLGDADIQDLLLGIGNDGHLAIDGTTRAGFILQDDHSMWITSSAVCWRSHDWPAGMPLSEYLHHEVPVERNDLPKIRVRSGRSRRSSGRPCASARCASRR